MNLNTENWTKFGQTVNGEFFEVEPHIIAVVPFEGSTDDGATARLSIETQLAYLRSKGMRAAVIVFMDPVLQQTSEARTVYREAADPAYQACFALVGGTVFGRAVASVFLGLSRPRVPIMLFSQLDEALQWCRSQTENQ